MDRRPLAVVFGLVGVLVFAVVALQTGLWVDIVGVGSYDEGQVTVYNESNATATGVPATEAGTESASEGTTTDGEENPTVAVRSNDTQRLAAVEVRISDTYRQRYVGLSETESLEPNEGMLFVHDEEGEFAYVMRNMSFPLDIIFIDANGTITTIHHAPLPPEGTDDLKRYEGRGKYVLEVNRGWANRTGVSVGDRVELPESIA
ncbi:DUF192 domain-containing protein [Haloarcula amylovorans]|uniref:DUF192 domain-containing protein n=1 Tax=Haloarcula amylovorans TaxID=2562280 RepID=UPI001076A62A|nr:DUF192 domain-containing protein [Halomicroarcula amylolytica]